MSKKSATRGLKIIAIVVFVLLFIVIGLVSFFSIKTYNDRLYDNEPEIFGYNVASVGDTSMEPQISKGSAVFYKPTGDDAFFIIEDILMLEKEDDYFPIKRAISSDYVDGKMFYCLKGDAEKGSVVVSVPEVYGKVYYSLPFLGFLLEYTATFSGLVFSIAVPLAALIFIEIILLLIILIVKKKENKIFANVKILPDDEDENFVDVTSDYVGENSPKPQNFLIGGEKSLEKFPGLDFNPLKNRVDEPNEELESVTINTSDVPKFVEKPKDKMLTVSVENTEMFEMSLKQGQTFKIKAGGHTVKIDVLD